MIDAIIRFSVRNKLIIGLLILILIGWGIYSIRQVPIDAVPDITNNQVQVITVSPTLAPQEIEQSITYPVEIAMANIPGVVEIRSISKFGLSVITIVFEERIPILNARQLVNEQIQVAIEDIPPGFGKPEMMPITTGLGEIFQYILEPKPGYESRYTPMELRTIQDWIVKRYLSGVPGIVETSSFGGYVKQVEISLDPERLRGMDITVNEVFDAIAANNENTGGSYIERGKNALYVRAIGLVRTGEEIGNILVRNDHGVPVQIRDIATVNDGYLPRFGAMTRNGEGEVVGGITLMLKGANSNEVIGAVLDRIEQIKSTLPEGLQITPYLDRSSLVRRTIKTVWTNLIEGGLIVIFVLVILLGNLRAGLIVASVIPLSLLFAFGMMHVFGVSANLMSLGAIDFGLIVDGAVIIVESAVHIFQTRFIGKRLTQADMDEEVISSTGKILKYAAFGVLIILMVYLPILALEGIEGKMFIPMAQTVSFALLGALLLSFTYVPMAASLFLNKQWTAKRSFSDRFIDWIYRIYRPFLRVSMNNRLVVLGVAILMFGGSAWLFSRMGGEFIPQLNEGDLAMQMAIPPGSSLSESIRMSTRAEATLKQQFPEVAQIVSKIGTAEIPTDPMSVEDADIMIILTPKTTWVSAKTREELVDKMKAALVPLEAEGATFEFTQPIELRFNELLTGSKGDIAVKIYGEELDVLADKGEEAAVIIREIPGAADVKVDRTEGFPQILIEYDRDRMAAYGLHINTVNQSIRTAFAGSVAGMVFEGERRFDLAVRLAKPFRNNLNDINDLMIRLDNSTQIPIREIAQVSLREGPMLISRDDTRRQITIGVNVRNRDVESLVAEISQRLEQDLDLPPGYALRYGGEFEQLQSAKDRLMFTVPLVLGIIFILLYFAFNSMRQALMIFTAIPMAAIGGVVSLWLRGMPFSISAGVGFIALFGVAVLNGIVLIGYFNQLHKEGINDKVKRIIEGTRVRLRPVLMTASVASLGFLPMALSTSAGAEVQRPLATVVIGGLITATILTLLVLPVIYSLFSPSTTPTKMTKSVVSALVLLLLCGPIFGQEPSSPIPITLEQAIEQAKQVNPHMVNARLRIQEADTRKSTAWDIPATQLQLQRGQMNTEAVDNAWSLNQSLGKPIEMAARQRQIKRESDVLTSELSLSSHRLSHAITQVYYRWLWYDQKLQVLTEAIPHFEDLVAITKLQHQTGESPLLLQVSAEATRGNLSIEVAGLKQQLEITALQLQELLFSDTLYVPISQPPVALPMPTPNTSLMADHPLIARSRQAVALEEARIRVNRSQISPGLQAGLFTQQIDGEAGFTGFQVGVSFPLWFVPQRAAAQAAAINRDIATNQLGHQEFLLHKKEARLSEQAGQYRKHLDYYQDQALPKATLLLEQAELLYREGEIDYTDYVKHLTEAMHIRTQWLDTLHAYNQTIINLTYLIE